MTMVDAQFNVARLLRPFAGFEAAYQADPSSLPIMFTEGGVALDPQAGQPGYAPELLKGLAVPFGARVTVFLPRITGLSGGIPQSVYPYRWEFTWRMRNVFDHRQQRVPFHLRKQGAGVPDAGSPRVVIPAAAQTIVYPESPEPATGIPNANLRTERVRVELGLWSRPFVDAAGVTLGSYQQGLFDPAVSVSIALAPLYGAYDMHALGDELLVGVTRAADPISGANGPEPNWEFAAAETDRNLSILFGNGSGSTFPDIGIYVLMGTAP